MSFPFNQSCFLGRAAVAMGIVTLVALWQSTSVSSDEPPPSSGLLDAIRELESARDPKCHSTACRFEDFIYGTPLTAEAREAKVSLQKELVRQVIRDATQAATGGERDSITEDDVRGALKQHFRTQATNDGKTIVHFDGLEPIEVSMVRQRQMASIAYSLRAILSVQQDSLLGLGPPMLPLEHAAIDRLQAGIDTVTLCAFKGADEDARIAHESVVSAERWARSWRRLVPEAAGSGANSDMETQRSDSSPADDQLRQQLMLMIDGKLKAYTVYNETTPGRGQQRFLKNVRNYYALYMTPIHEVWITRLLNAYGVEMSAFADSLVSKAGESAREDGRQLIRSSDATAAVMEMLPHEVDDFEDVTFFDHLPTERVTLESYDCDSFRDTGFHWQFLKQAFSQNDHLMVPDPFAAEIFTEAISDYGVLLLRMAGQVATELQDAPALRPHHLEQGRHRIARLSRRHHQTAARSGSASSAIVSAETRSAETESKLFTQLNQLTGVGFVHDSAPWLHSFRRKSVVSYPTFSGGGVAADDVDGDGHVDLLLVGGGGNALYFGDGEGGFQPASLGLSGTNQLGEARQPLIVDFDNDGAQDIFISYANDAHRLFRNVGGRQFEDVTASAGLGGDGQIGGPATAFDFDDDGLLDLYITCFGDYLHGAGPKEERNNTNALPNQLFRNLGDMEFENVTEGSGAADTGWCQAVSHTDFDRDGRQDIVVANDFGRNALLSNLGNGKFANVGEALGHTKAYHSMNVGITDLNQDGFPDLYISNIATMVKDNKYTFPDVNTPKKLDLSALSNMLVKEANVLYVSQVDNGQLVGHVASESVDRGESSTGWAWDAEFFDADNDGDDDLYVTNGTNDYNVFSKVVSLGGQNGGKQKHVQLTNRREANVFYLNEAGRLRNRSAASGADFSGNSRSTAYLDWDDDGDLDVIVNNFHGPIVALENNAQRLGNHWLKIRLVGKPTQGTNRDAVGARLVATTANGLSVAREVQAGSGYLSQNPKEQHFGLGTATDVSLTIHWPGGEVQRVENLVVDRVHVIEQSSSSSDR